MKGGRQVLVVKRFEAANFNESTILDVDLSGLGDALRFYRSGPSAVRDWKKPNRNGATNGSQNSDFRPTQAFCRHDAGD
ncbi:hypothetical protein [Roseibium aggregatum]|uniref:hypothetical protein n=1 Tax=Roseibium aggregatum TaxID=187304 RepID=UPI001E3B0F88|nr:hypothetical protein [Roseibium aggregatum]